MLTSLLRRLNPRLQVPVGVIIEAARQLLQFDLNAADIVGVKVRHTASTSLGRYRAQHDIIRQNRRSHFRLLEA